MLDYGKSQPHRGKKNRTNCYGFNVEIGREADCDVGDYKAAGGNRPATG